MSTGEAVARNSSRAFRKVAGLIVLRDGAMCWLCGHGNAITVDHVIPYRDWPKDHEGKPLPGLDSPDNLKAAHGTRGSAEANPCNECGGKLCNQSRGASSPMGEAHSRRW